MHSQHGRFHQVTLWHYSTYTVGSTITVMTVSQYCCCIRVGGTVDYGMTVTLQQAKSDRRNDHVNEFQKCAYQFPVTVVGIFYL